MVLVKWSKWKCYIICPSNKLTAKLSWGREGSALHSTFNYARVFVQPTSAALRKKLFIIERKPHLILISSVFNKLCYKGQIKVCIIINFIHSHLWSKKFYGTIQHNGPTRIISNKHRFDLTLWNEDYDMSYFFHSKHLTSSTYHLIFAKKRSQRKKFTNFVSLSFQVLRMKAENSTFHGVATHSSGNHGQALALACKENGISCSVVVPRGTAKVKLESIVRNGAELVQCPPTYVGR